MQNDHWDHGSCGSSSDCPALLSSFQFWSWWTRSSSRHWSGFVSCDSIPILPSLIAFGASAVGARNLLIGDGAGLGMLQLCLLVLCCRALGGGRILRLLSLATLELCLFQESLPFRLLLPHASVLDLVLPNQSLGWRAKYPFILAEFAYPDILHSWWLMIILKLLVLTALTSCEHVFFVRGASAYLWYWCYWSTTIRGTVHSRHVV